MSTVFGSTDSGVTLSGGNLIATKASGSDGTCGNAYSQVAFGGASKIYAEATCTLGFIDDVSIFLGISDGSSSLGAGNLPGSISGTARWQANGQWGTINNSVVGTFRLTVGIQSAIALDVGANDLAGGVTSPPTRHGRVRSVLQPLLSLGNIQLVVTVLYASESWTANFDGTVSAVATPTSGYTRWDGSGLSSAITGTMAATEAPDISCIGAFGTLISWLQAASGGIGAGLGYSNFTAPAIPARVNVGDLIYVVLAEGTSSTTTTGSDNPATPIRRAGTDH
jgi:hypothetical protein